VTDLVRHDSVAVTNHVLGLLSDSEARTVEAHLAGCAQCTTDWAAVRDTVVALDELPPEFFDQTPADPSDLVFQRTLRAIGAE
jgi:anti-sigma factor RsiW